ncbi:hypothetical protein AJ78_09061 [Emergomyces pasteurianus Ep9510]|uniref:Uncharacterized protein n=1 Tax=Emergomyces pasteurianus Ep9510 TaxID=1447872 RepID=A0A1J9P0U6_9EURO|nr:hypothetical protein AJ78_09061 [Emergomyces pasteurianus Ep9510]
MATVAAQQQSNTFISDFLTVPEQRDQTGAFARMPPLAPAEQMRVSMTIRQRR